jgi:hypothetical protein
VATIPTLEAVVEAPLDDVAAVAPATVIVSVNGTRRSAALEGITPHTDTFVRWSRQPLLAYMEIQFAHGGRNVIAAAIISPNMREFASYRERFLGWTADGLAGGEMLGDYAERGWRVRMMGTEHLPELRESAEALVRATPERWSHTLWWTVTPTPEAPWASVLDTVARTGATTRAEAIRALYGEDIPPATMFISFGKPIIIYDLIPPLLAGQLQSYWIMRPGYRLDARMFRTILYDYAYVRPGHAAADQYAGLLAHRQAWETEAVLGLGQRLGPFWYPAPFPAAEAKP